MTISELVAALEQIKAEHGDLECDTYNDMHERDEVALPSVAWRRLPEHYYTAPNFWEEGMPKSKRGEKVVRL